MGEFRQLGRRRPFHHFPSLRRLCGLGVGAEESPIGEFSHPRLRIEVVVKKKEGRCLGYRRRPWASWL